MTTPNKSAIGQKRTFINSKNTDHREWPQELTSQLPAWEDQCLEVNGSDRFIYYIQSFLDFQVWSDRNSLGNLAL